jgi:hypothetical protein
MARRKRARVSPRAAQDFVEAAAAPALALFTVACFLPVLFPFMMPDPTRPLPPSQISLQDLKPMDFFTCAPPAIPGACVQWPLDAPPIAISCGAMYDVLFDPYAWSKRFYARI